MVLVGMRVDSSGKCRFVVACWLLVVGAELVGRQAVHGDDAGIFEKQQCFLELFPIRSLRKFGNLQLEAPTTHCIASLPKKQEAIGDGGDEVNDHVDENSPLFDACIV
jgi:hypothetical protein